MGLTQVSKDGVKNDAIDASKLPANSVGASELADNAVDTNAITNDAVTISKIQNVAQDRILGRQSSGSGDLQELNAGNVRLMLNVADGANQTTINSNADNRVITGSDTANTLEGEANLTFNGGATGDAQLTIHAAEANANSDSELILETSNDFATSIIKFKDSTAEAGSVAYNHGDNYIKFSTNGTTERMRISSDGYVTKPNTPSFLVFPANNAETADGDVTYTNVSHNVGNHYSTSTGRFTAPVAGYYSFFANYVGESGCTSCQVMFKQNGSITNTGNHYSGNGSSYMSCDLSGTHTYLAANDYIQLNLNAGGASQGQSSYMRFFGYLTH